MNEQEVRLVNLIRESSDPAEAIKVAMEVILDYLSKNDLCSVVENSPEYYGKVG